MSHTGDGIFTFGLVHVIYLDFKCCSHDMSHNILLINDSFSEKLFQFMLAKPVSKWVSLNNKWYRNWGMFGTETNFESFLCEITCIVRIGSIPLGARPGIDPLVWQLGLKKCFKNHQN